MLFRSTNVTITSMAAVSGSSNQPNRTHESPIWNQSKLCTSGTAPPPEAGQACKGAQDGTAGSFTSGSQSITGTCRTGPDGQASACLPARPNGPPPEAFQACQSLTAGAACTVNFHGQDVTGTCRTGPQGAGALACAPARPPGR